MNVQLPNGQSLSCGCGALYSNGMQSTATGSAGSPYTPPPPIPPPTSFIHQGMYCTAPEILSYDEPCSRRRALNEIELLNK